MIEVIHANFKFRFGSEENNFLEFHLFNNII